MGLAGIVFLLAVAYGLSTDRRAIRLPTVLWGLGLQLTLALLVLKTPFRAAFHAAGQGVNQLMKYGEEGSGFIFGDLGKADGPMGVTIAFQILPLIIFVSAVFAVLYYLGIMQRVVRVIAVVMQRTMKVSGAEAMNLAANVFMGQSEAPLTIRPYLDRLTKSELMAVMTGGMGTISGALLVAYVGIAGVPVEHLLTAVIMSAPGCVVFAKIMVPETGTPDTLGRIPDDVKQDDVNLIDAAARGTSEGLYLALNVGAMLVAFVGLIALANGLYGWVRELSGLLWMPAGIQGVLGWLFAPVAFLLGVPWKDAPDIGNLLGTRMVLNEFIAYVQLGQIKETLDPRSFLIAGYALCGFANFGSVGIQVGGIASLIPKRRKDLAVLGMRAMIAGTFANFLTAAIAGLLVG